MHALHYCYGYTETGLSMLRIEMGGEGCVNRGDHGGDVGTMVVMGSLVAEVLPKKYRQWKLQTDDDRGGASPAPALTPLPINAPPSLVKAQTPKP